MPWPFSTSKGTEQPSDQSTAEKKEPESGRLYFFEDVESQLKPLKSESPLPEEEEKPATPPPPPPPPPSGFFGKLFGFFQSFPVFTKDPGTYDSLTNSVANVTDATNELHDGMKVTMQRSFGENFMVSHEFAFGSTVEPPAYHFTTYWAASEGSSMLVGGIDHTGKTNARIMQKFMNKRLGIEFQSQSTPDLKLDYMLSTDIHDGLGGHPTLRWASSQGVLALGHAQQITERWSAGIESIFLLKQGISGVGASMKYAGKHNGWTAMLAPLNGTAMLGYLQHMGPGVQAGAMLTGQATQTGDIESSVQAGVVWEPKRQGTRYKATLDTNMKVCCTYNEMFGGVGMLKFAAELDHPKNEYKFGLAFEVMM